MRKLIIAVAVVFAVLLLTHANTGTALAWSPGYHVVRPGQTLYSIATMYGLSAWALANANGLWNPNLIYVGQTLLIPGAGYCYTCYNRPYINAPYSTYRPPYNYYAPPYYSPMPSLPGYPRTSYACSYRVTYGDTLSTIAARYGTTAWALASANGISNLNWIYAGQWLRIPGCN